jgi:hypothetical protein
MVDVDRRMNGGHSQAHIAAGLKRLCARANKGPNAPTSLRKGLVSFTALAKKIIDRLKKCDVLIEKGLSGEEVARIEAEFGFTFPPDLRAVLQEGLPVGVGFPDWRSEGSQQLRMRLNLPVAGLSYEVVRGKFWWKQWGQRPSDTESAAKFARQALKKVPILVPLYEHCYIPSSPALAGNPVFFVYQTEVFCYGYDLSDFFGRQTFDPCDRNFDFMAKKVMGRSLRREKTSSIIRRHVDVAYCKEKVHHLSRSHNSSKREKCEDAEDWGRTVDAVAKYTDVNFEKDRNSDWCRRSLDERCMMKSCQPSMGNVEKSPGLVRDKPISDKILANLAAANPSFPCSPKTLRWIEFWTELVEKRHSSCMGSPRSSSSSSSSSSKVAVDLVKSAAQENRNDNRLQCRSMPQWMLCYLEDLAALLRNGGWREEDISDIVQVSSTPLDPDNVLFDSQAVLEGMLLKADSMSESLRRAGWSSQDVSEAFDFDFAITEPRRPAKKLSHEFVQRIGKLAEFVGHA